jgi:hypothetical protein
MGIETLISHIAQKIKKLCLSAWCPTQNKLRIVTSQPLHLEEDLLGRAVGSGEFQMVPPHSPCSK